MAPAKKKPVKKTGNYLKACVNNVYKYSTGSRQPVLTVAGSHIGLQVMASKNLQIFYDKYAQEIKEAARLDSIGLLDPRDEIRATFFPKDIDQNSPLESFVINNTTPFLPFPLELMETAEIIPYVLAEMRRDLLETKGLLTERIFWGNPNYEPSR